MGFIKCIFGVHEWKTTGFWSKNDNGGHPDGEYQTECINCRESYWSNNPPDVSLITELVKADKAGEFDPRK